MKDRAFNVRVTKVGDNTVHIGNCIDSDEYTESYKIFVLKSNIMRGLFERGLTNKHIPYILNLIPDTIYGKLIKKESRESKYYDDYILVTANYIVASLGMTSTSVFTIDVITDILHEILK